MHIAAASATGRRACAWGARALRPGVQLGLWDVLVLATVAGLFAWRGLALIPHWRGRRPTDP